MSQVTLMPMIQHDSNPTNGPGSIYAYPWDTIVDHNQSIIDIWYAFSTTLSIYIEMHVDDVDQIKQGPPDQTCLNHKQIMQSS